jgi:hypothetical protein
MKKFILIANAVLTLPFGIAALISPVAVFSGFGIPLDPGAQLIARGYAATCIGYGLIFLLLQGSQDNTVARALILASLFFNAIEAVIQGMAGAAGVANAPIWITVAAHTVIALLSVMTLIRQPRNV